LLRLSLAAACALLMLASARAAEPEPCPGLIATAPPRVERAALAEHEVALTFVGHATFLIETAGGVRIATDYNDFLRPAGTPDIVTMNKAHNTHFSVAPDPGIRHVLRGWNPGGGRVVHDFTLADVRVRNVPTNIRHWSGGTEIDGNSIFVFETARLCIAHLGHLHHALTPEQLASLGRIDVLLVPVDGGYTLETFDMMDVLKAINAPLMLPMHYFNRSTLDRFVSLARQHYEVEFSRSASITLSRERLPNRPKVLVLPGP
jgi:L-ascorbate metabolism protein UlaG (beta-lactamase superfamily)